MLIVHPGENERGQRLVDEGEETDRWGGQAKGCNNEGINGCEKGEEEARVDQKRKGEDGVEWGEGRRSTIHDYHKGMHAARQ